MLPHPARKDLLQAYVAAAPPVLPTPTPLSQWVLLTELGFPPTGPTPQGCDNKAARDTAYNPENHERMKHVERRHLYIR